MSTNPTSVIRKLTDDDFDPFVDIWVKAYPGAVPDDFSDERKQGLKERWTKLNSEVSTINFYGSFQNDKLLGGMILFDYTMTLLGTQVDAGGIGNVCVDLLHKREHVAKNLMLFSHDHYLKKNACLTALYPFRHDFYAKMGYGLGKKVNQYRFKGVALPKTTKNHVTYLDASDSKQLTESFNRFASQRHGMILRVERSFQRLLGSLNVVGYKKDGQIQGYLAFRFRKLDQEKFIKNELVIEEFICETREAFAELLTFLHTQDDQVHRIVYNTQDDYFSHVLSDPRNGSDAFFSTSQESNLQGVGIMYRVINAQQLFLVLKDHNFGNQTVRLKLSIEDSFLQENDGSFIVDFANGMPQVANDQDKFDVEVKLKVADFSSMVMGVISFKKLYNYYLAEISDLRYLEAVNRLFRTEAPPMTIEQF